MREDINRDARYTESTANDYHQGIPDRFNINKWESIDLAVMYQGIEKVKQVNDKLEKCKELKNNYDTNIEQINNKYQVKDQEQKELRELRVGKIQKNIDQEADEIDIKINNINDAVEELQEKINELEKETAVLVQEKIALKTKEFEARKETIEVTYTKEIESISKLKAQEVEVIDSQISEADKFLLDNRETDTEQMKQDAVEAERMKAMIPNYLKSIDYYDKVSDLKQQSNELTGKLELARELPGQILEQSVLPIPGMMLTDGVVKILNSNGTYVKVDNLSDGEKLELCIEIAKAKSGVLKVILVDGFEKLDATSQEQFIEKAKSSGLQYFITRVSDTELTVTEY